MARPPAHKGLTCVVSRREFANNEFTSRASVRSGNSARIAALQAPVIIMSQRRQEMKDRLRAENDYNINLKTELEIRQLHEKMDHQLARQWERLAEMRQIQIELLEERAPR